MTTTSSTTKISRIGKSVQQVEQEYKAAGVHAPAEFLSGDLVCAVSEIHGRNNHKQYVSIVAGSVVMLLNCEVDPQLSWGTKKILSCKVLYKDSIVTVQDADKLYYLEHGTTLKDLTFCITGKLTHARDYYASMISFQQGKFKKNINKDLNYLVYGKDVGATKTTKARQNGVKMITEAELLALILKNKAEQAKNP